MKLSRKKSIRLAFLAHKLALSIGHDERMALLAELLDELGIDAEQREDSRKSAQHHLHYEASRKRKNQQAAKQAGDIDNMSHEDLQAYIQQLYAKRDRLLREREQRPDIDAMSDEERAAYQAHLMHSIAAKLDPAPAPDPAPTVEDAPQYNVTSTQRRRLAAFDDMSDSDQVDTLRGMWGTA